jgi:V/A-type H+-transporting ATPase subunit I
MYGWPNYNEFDPTPILGPFFLLFFALCIGDAGYGILLTLIGYLIYKDKLKIEMFEGLGGIIMALGVGSTVIGYLMGGFFGIDLFRAAWFPEWAKAPMFNNLGVNGKIGEYDVMMVLTILIGVVHLILAMTIKAITYTIRDGFKATVSTWGWLLLIVGGICTAIVAMLFSLPTNIVKWTLIAIGGVSALGIFVFNTPGRNPLINVGAGLWDTYQMTTGLLGDVLSYIRLYALGLAGGMLGAAFNQLGTQVLGENPNIGTWVGFILIVTFGHVLNLLMACLGAFVHPLRLSFVEYFKNAGYEGNGKLYQPFKK